MGGKAGARYKCVRCGYYTEDYEEFVEHECEKETLTLDDERVEEV